jgi:PBSX family phage terminase large subunit
MVAFDYKPFSRKQLDFIANSTAEINIATGSIRSGKTIAANVAFMTFVKNSPYDQHLITGRTRDSIYRNVLHPLFKMLDGEDVVYKKIDGIIEWDDKEIYVIGLNDEQSADKVRGLTVHSWYADEILTSPRKSVILCDDRCSLKGNRQFWTCNPGSPYHFIYTDFITNTELINLGKIKVWHFGLDDNLTLTESYKERIKRTHTGVEYERDILGKWVVAEGSIFPQFREDVHILRKPVNYKNYDSFRIGLDYGTASETVYVLVGLKYVETKGDNGHVIYHCLKEWVHNAKEKKAQLTDKEFSNKMELFMDNIPRNTVINVPHDARSLNKQFERDGFETTMINPNVNTGINRMADLFRDKHLMVHEECPNVVQAIQNYVWDEKALLKGVEKPKKYKDHPVDALRYAVDEGQKIKPFVTSVGYW